MVLKLYMTRKYHKLKNRLNRTKRGGNNSVPIPSTIPSTSSIFTNTLGIGAQVIDNLIKQGFVIITHYVGHINPDKTFEQVVNENIDKLNELAISAKNILQNPENQEKIKNIINELNEVGIKIIAPAFENTANIISNTLKEQAPILGKYITNVINETPIGLVTNAVGIAEKTAELAQTSGDAVVKLLNTASDTKERIISNKNVLDDLTKNMNTLQYGGSKKQVIKTIKHLHKGGIKSLKRALKTKDEFLNNKLRRKL